MSPGRTLLHSSPQKKTEKGPLLAAIETAAFIRPREALDMFGDLLDSDDEDIVDAVHEAIASEPWYDEDDEDDDFLH